MRFKISSAICFNLDKSKILSSGNGLKSAQMMKPLFDSVENIVEKENAGKLISICHLHNVLIGSV